MTPYDDSADAAKCALCGFLVKQHVHGHHCGMYVAPAANVSKTCETCRFRKPDPRDDYKSHGECRRLPPVPMCWTGQDGYSNATAHYEQHWPFMQPDDWCGEHKPTETQK